MTCFSAIPLLLAAIFSAAEPQPTPAIRPLVAFAVPLSDGTTATAIVFPTQPGQACLVTVAATGQVATYTITPTPPPPNPPTPPTPTKLSIAIVENPATTTPAQAAVLGAKEWRELAASKHQFLGIIPSDIKEATTGKPPAYLQPFLDAAAGNPLPWLLMSDPSGKLLYTGPLPTTAQAMTELLKKYGG
jgi:hypothetical protein